MTKKWSTELINEYLNENHNGYSVKGNYETCDSKLEFTCPNNHISIKAFTSFKDSKNKCNQCRVDKMNEDHHDKFISLIKEEKYNVLEFVKDKRVLVQCPNEHAPYEVKTSNFICGRRCPSCRNEKLAEERKHSYEFVKEYIEYFNYTLESKSYTNNETHLQVSCDRGHDCYLVTFNNFKAGNRCPYCDISRKKSYDEVKYRVEKHGYILLTEKQDFKNTKDRLRVVCPNGHETSKVISSIDGGSGCLTCAIINKGGENGSNWRGGITPITEYFRNHIEEWKLASLSEYGFTCAITDSSKDLEIHHLIPYSSLVQEMFRSLQLDIRPQIKDYSMEELELMKKEILRLHMLKLGVPLNKKVHKLFHMTFGFHNNNENQYLFYKEHYDKFKTEEFTKINYENHLKGNDV